ncbi:MAG: MBL fold metallo-hydrolase [Candidatus Heimdallarchaeota archaeon]|nr:MAG: MBL fold metallo-hydrolase [Candidatus Heimdallarchaeota archaeon]
MTQNRIEAIKSLYSLELNNNDAAFIFLGYSGIILRLKTFTMAFDPGKGLDLSEISAIEHLDLLSFTHNHWDHYNKEKALQLFAETGTHIVADIISSEELSTSVPTNLLTVGDAGSSFKTYRINDFEVSALRGVHVGPISQYLVNLGRLKVFHGGDSGYWRHPDVSADIAFVPIGTARTCSPAVALAMVMDLQPKIAVPIHGQKQEMKKFRVLVEKVLPDIEVIVPERFKLIKISI